MTTNAAFCDRASPLWAASSVALGAAAALNPFYQPHIPPGVAIGIWFFDLTLSVVLAGHRVAARAGTLAAGLLMAVPCFVKASPFGRFLLMCLMALPWAMIALPTLAPHPLTRRGHLHCFFTWLGTRKIQRRTRHFDTAAFCHLVVAALALAGTMACVKEIPADGLWMNLRWLAAGIMILAFAEMATSIHNGVTALLGIRAPALLRSPGLARSISEFWSQRWNPAASQLGFRPFFYKPMARHGIIPAVGAAFLASAVAHFLLMYMATGLWGVSFAWGGFFLVQPVLILLERRLKVRHWPPAAARIWTLTALAIVSPLFSEPALRLLEPNWGLPGSIWVNVAVTFSFLLGLVLFFALGSLMTCPEPPLHTVAQTGSGVRPPTDQGNI